MSYKIVFFDIDGTLVNEEARIPFDAKEAIYKLKERNIEVAFATGRAPFHFKHIAEELGIDSFVSFNGSYVVHKGRVIYERSINRDSLELLEEHAHQFKHPIVYLSHKECYANYSHHPYIIESFQSLKLEAPSYHPHYWKDTKIYQALLYCHEHEEIHYQGKFADLAFIRWHRLSMDVLPVGGSKAKGIEVMLKHLKLSPGDAVAFGDGLNDKEMLSFVGMGIAMGNAHEEVKPFAKFTTKHINDGGIRYGLQQIGLI
ncbi:Cof-type HAD-IIB family hydrolase [Parageobacillus thermoglucosidasius]|jgi:Cof subfamily protein (haloacid dehalogenase superfamily)|uniref:Cof-type HAD-IIB family hydrolase n=1 Tax=Parageobacillus thermoglucosidasius TaxID=1426 RepID=UPI003B66CE32